MKPASVRIALAICASLYCSIAFSQNEGTIYFMNSLPQVSYVNPAFFPTYRFSIGLPGSSVFVQYANNGFSYNSFATQVNDSTQVNLDKLYRALKKKNYITTAFQADLFRLSLRMSPRLYLTINATAKSYNRIMLPKDLTGIFINGTSSYVNGTASLSPEVESMAYLETALGFAYKVNERFAFGVRVKVLKGIANATTQRAKVDLSLDGDYAITATADVNARTSGLHNLTDSDYKLSDHWRDYLKNNGLGFDIGATYNVNDRLVMSISAIDIGSITWNNDPYEYTLDPAKANYVYKGIDLQRILKGDNDYLQHEGDSISKKFELQEGVRGSYRTPLPGKMYLSGNYKLKTNLYAGGLIFAEKFRGRLSVGGTLSLHKEFGRRLSTSISYTISNNSYNNVGLGLSLNVAPFQIYLVGDNILRAPLAMLTSREINPYLNSMQYFNLRAGLNFVFGWYKEPEKLPHPTGKTKSRL